MENINQIRSQKEWTYTLLFVLVEIILFGLLIINPNYSLILVMGIIIGLFLYYSFFKNPFLIVVLMIFSTGLNTWGRVFGGLTLFHLTWAISILSFLSYYLFHHKISVKFQTPINKYLFGYIIFSFFSLTYSPDPLGGISSISIVIALFIFFLFVVNTIESDIQYKYIVYTLVTVNVFLSALIFYQLINFDPWNIVNPVEIAGGEKIPRPAGTFKDPNVTAAFLMMGIIFSISFIFYLKKNYFEKFILVITTLISLAGIAATFSRSGWLSLFLGIVTVLFFQRNKKIIFIFLITLAGLFSFFIFFTPYGEFIIFRVVSIFDLMGDVSVRTRIFMAASGIEMFFDNPIIGVGYRGFPVYYDLYIHPLTPQVLLYVKESHTLFITLLAELGLFGLFLIFFWFKKIFRDSYLLIKNNENDLVKAVLIGCFANFVTFNINCLFYGNIFPHFNLFWLLLAIIYSIYFRKRESQGLL